MFHCADGLRFGPGAGRNPTVSGSGGGLWFVGVSPTAEKGDQFLFCDTGLESEQRASDKQPLLGGGPSVVPCWRPIGGVSELDGGWHRLADRAARGSVVRHPLE